MQIITPAIPRRLQVTQAMTDDFYWDPILACWFFFKIKLDWFQRVRLKIFMHIPLVIDSSGFSSGKTIVDWVYGQLRCLLIPGHAGVVYYPSFETGKRVWWPYYTRVQGNAIYRAHLGRLDEVGEEVGKAKTQGAGCYTAHYKNGAKFEMPAPNLIKESPTMASTRVHTSIFEEWTHIMAMGDAISKQLVGRNTAPSFGNENHPFWGNHWSYTAPAKTKLHPAYPVVQGVETKIKKGNPTHFHLHFCYKDFSPSFKDSQGRSVRMDKAVKMATEQMSDSERLGEAYGIWGANTNGWYTEVDLLRALTAGMLAKVRVCSSRAEDDAQNPQRIQTNYFMGIDPAPSESAASDDGAISILRARRMIDRGAGFSQNAADYDLSWCYLRRVRGADARQWGAMVHALHRAFGISKMVLDHGAAGGGPLIRKEIAKAKQPINGIDIVCRPILLTTSLGIDGDFILHEPKRSDPGIEQTFDGKMTGEDVLIDRMHVEMRDALMRTLIKWPMPLNELAEAEKPPPLSENFFSVINLTGALQMEYPGLSKDMGTNALEQFSNLGVVMTEDRTTYALTRNGARQFVASKGKKDFVSAMLNAYIAFQIWLKLGSVEEEEDADAVHFSGF